jgi:hypothetical protein
MKHQVIVDILNDYFKLDQDAMKALVDHRVEINQALADEDSVTYMQEKDDDPRLMGLVGLLNGILTRYTGSDGPRIAAVYSDDAGTILSGFTVIG